MAPAETFTTIRSAYAPHRLPVDVPSRPACWSNRALWQDCSCGPVRPGKARHHTPALKSSGWLAGKAYSIANIAAAPL